MEEEEMMVCQRKIKAGEYCLKKVKYTNEQDGKNPVMCSSESSVKCTQQQLPQGQKGNDRTRSGPWHPDVMLRTLTQCSVLWAGQYCQLM